MLKYCTRTRPLPWIWWTGSLCRQIFSSHKIDFFILCVSYAVLCDSKFVVTTQCFYILCKVWNIDLLQLYCLLVDVYWYILIIRVIEHAYLFPLSLSLTWIMIIKSNHLRRPYAAVRLLKRLQHVFPILHRVVRLRTMQLNNQVQKFEIIRDLSSAHWIWRFGGAHLINFCITRFCGWKNILTSLRSFC